jgi:hypothetical protein
VRCSRRPQGAHREQGRSEPPRTDTGMRRNLLRIALASLRNPAPPSGRRQPEDIEEHLREGFGRCRTRLAPARHSQPRLTQ